MEITMNCQTRHTFSRSLNTFSASEFHIQLHYSAYYSWSLRNVSKKVINKKTYNFSYKIVIFPKQKNFRTDVSIRFHALRTLGAGAAIEKSLPQPFFKIFFPIKPACWRSLSDSWNHKVPQSILYMNCYFPQEHHKIAKHNK